MFHTDKMGSVVAMSNATNGQLATNGGPFAYDSYGNCFVSGTPCSTAGRLAFTLGSVSIRKLGSITTEPDITRPPSDDSSKRTRLDIRTI